MAHAQSHGADAPQEQVHLGTLAPMLLRLGAVLFVAGMGIGIGLWASGAVDTSRFLHGWLLAVVYFLSISLGALFFVQVQHLTRAGWSTGIRRLAEILAAGTPVIALFLLPLVINVLMGRTDLFVWADPAAIAHEPVVTKKLPFLNPPFFAVRTLLYFVVWAFFGSFFFRHSRAQDTDGDWQHSYTMQWVAAPAIACFALSVSFFAFDYLMSLEATFYSTVYGIYYFAGCAMSFFATMAVLLMWLQGKGILATSVSKEHYHDIGKFLFGFVFFWSYIAFSQYMLIWYGNIPEETQWFLRRQSDAWVGVSIALLVGHTLLPFPGLLSRHVKRSRGALAFWATWLLLVEYLDLFWLTMPSGAMVGHDTEHLLPPRLGLLEVSLWLGMAGVFLVHFALRARHVALRPLKDPRLGEALAFENI